MSEFITNVVTSLTSLRDQYRDGLKEIPAYSAFLLVESSTAAVAEALGAAGDSSSAAEIVDALKTAQDKFRTHIATVPEYRVLTEINKLITTLTVNDPVKETESASAAPVNQIIVTPESSASVNDEATADTAVADAPANDTPAQLAETAANESIAATSELAAVPEHVDQEQPAAEIPEAAVSTLLTAESHFTADESLPTAELNEAPEAAVHETAAEDAVAISASEAPVAGAEDIPGAQIFAENQTAPAHDTSGEHLMHTEEGGHAPSHHTPQAVTEAERAA